MPSTASSWAARSSSRRGRRVRSSWRWPSWRCCWPPSTWSAASWSPTGCLRCSRAARPARPPVPGVDGLSAHDIAISLLYLGAAVLFIVGLKQLSSPKGARNGNTIAAVGMVIAIGTTFWVVAPKLASNQPAVIVIAVGMILGTIAGALSARQVKMTAMPQMVALFNGVGGGAAALVAISELMHESGSITIVLPSVLSVAIGGIS